MPAAVRLSGVVKRFGRRVAVEDVGFEVAQGEVFGLLGHNGAGKSTLLGMILGLVAPDGGAVELAGHAMPAGREAALRRVGAIFETPAFYGYLTGRQNLQLLVDCSGGAAPGEIEGVAARVGLRSRLGDKVRTYSHGMRQRLAIAQALLPRPEILILDEPSDGLDPDGMKEMRDLLAGLHREWGLTMILCSHLLGEVERLCQRVAILRAGRLVYCGDWRSEGSRRREVELETDEGEASHLVAEAAGLIEKSGAGWALREGRAVADVAEALVSAGHRIRKLRPVEHNLESVYEHATREIQGEGSKP